MIHVFVLYCMVLNPTQCLRYEIVPFNFDPVGSQMHCLKGGAIFATVNPYLTISNVLYAAKGGVRCEGDPPKSTDVQNWLDAQHERAVRLEPQIK